MEDNEVGNPGHHSHILRHLALAGAGGAVEGVEPEYAGRGKLLESLNYHLMDLELGKDPGGAPLRQAQPPGFQLAPGTTDPGREVPTGVAGLVNVTKRFFLSSPIDNRAIAAHVEMKEKVT